MRSTSIATRATGSPSACSRRSTSRRGSRPRSASSRRAGGKAPRRATWELEELKRLKRNEIEASIEHGTLLDAWARLIVYVRHPGDPADERPFNLFRRMIEEMTPESRPSLAALKAAIKRQAYALALDEARAIAALPKLAPDMDARRRGLDAAGR